MNDPEARPRATAKRVALAIAVGADALQWIALPLFAPGLPSLWDDALDAVIAIAMTRLVGWHPAFLPAVLAELVPGLNLFPSWTGAVWFVTRRKKKPPPAATPVP